MNHSRVSHAYLLNCAVSRLRQHSLIGDSMSCLDSSHRNVKALRIALCTSIERAPQENPRSVGGELRAYLKLQSLVRQYAQGCRTGTARERFLASRIRSFCDETLTMPKQKKSFFYRE